MTFLSIPDLPPANQPRKHGDLGGLRPALEKLVEELQGAGYDLTSVLAIPPDITRLHSGSGEVLGILADLLGESLREVIPAVGTHLPMTEPEIRRMYPDVSPELFQPHNFRTDVVTLGSIESAFIQKQSEGKLSFEYPVQVSRRIASGEHGTILSIGQVVPHEVVGMANHAKNIFVGTGGAEAINLSHYLGAVYGMERIMGVADTPVRRVLNRAAREFTGEIPIVYVLTVVGPGYDGHPEIKGLYAGDDEDCFYRAAELSRHYNVTRLKKAPPTVVVSLDPETYRSTWLGNKAIYRTRKAIATGGDLFIYAPGVHQFGEDPEIDRLIRKYGYCGTDNVLETVAREPDLAGNLSAAAHLIHGSSEGRFSVTYGAGHLQRREVENAGYHYMDPDTMAERFRTADLKDGWNTVDGEDVYYISQPGLGLWEADIAE